MEEQTLELRGIISRLEKLENENRRLKKIGAALSVLAAVILAMGQAPSSRTIEAEKFVLKDATRNARAVLGMFLGEPTLTLSDAKGQQQVLLEGGDHPVISLSRTGGKEQVTLMATEELYGLAVYGEPKGAINGTRVGLGVWKGVPGLTLYDGSGNERAAIQTEESGPSLKLTDSDGKAGFNVWIAPRAGPDLSMYDASGQLRVDLVAPNGGPSLKLEDENGYSAIFGSTDLVTPRTGRKEMTSAASLTLFGKDKKVLWSAP